MRRLAAFSVLAALALAGCITPSIPIPPPQPELMTFHFAVAGTASTVQFSYPADANYRGGVVYVYDRAQHAGVIRDVNPDDSIGPTPAMPGAVGDQVVVTIQGAAQTVSTCVRIREGTQSSTDYCGP